MKLNDYLISLGSTSEEVADSLRKQGIKGIVASDCKCPIINAIYKALPNYWPGLKIRNGRKRDNEWYYTAGLNDCQIIDPVLPKAVMNFIGDFDSWLYPDLAVKKVKEVTVRVWE